MTRTFACAAAVWLLALPARTPASDVVDYAGMLIGRPYVWGAEGPDAFDCSGLTQYVYQRFDVDLPRRAISQSKTGDPAGRRLERGDLLFFASDARRSLVTHVAIYEGGGTIIEASKRYGRVRRSSLDDEYLAERFMFARRIAPDGSVATVRDRGNSREDQRPVPTTRGDARRAAIRALAQIADTMLRRPSR
jgi:NlpC/P60 family protein